MTATSIYNVLDYGAVGDGVHDDAAAINAALAASATMPSPGGGMCYIPDGTFLLQAETVTVPASAHLLIDGTVILANDVSIDLVTLAGSNILIEGIGTLDGNEANQTSPTSGIVVAAGVSPEAVTVRGLTIQNVKGAGVVLTNTTNGLLDALTLTNTGATNTIGGGCSNCWARDVTITNGAGIGLAFYNGATACGIRGGQLAGNAVNLAVLADSSGGAPCSDITIANTVCSGATATEPGIAIRSVAGAIHSAILITGNETYGNGGGGIALTSVTDCTVSANNCHDDVGIEIEVGSLTSAAACARVSVVDNTCAASATGGTIGIAVHAPTGTGHTDLTVSGNTCSGNPGGALYISQVTGCVVANNLCEGDTGTELTVDLASMVVNVVGNNLVNVVADSQGNGYGIFVASTVAKLSLFHNLVWATSGGMTYAIVGGPNDDTYIHGNFMGGWTTAGSNYDTSGTNFQQSDNTVPIA